MTEKMRDLLDSGGRADQASAAPAAQPWLIVRKAAAPMTSKRSSLLAMCRRLRRSARTQSARNPPCGCLRLPLRRRTAGALPPPSARARACQDLRRRAAGDRSATNRRSRKRELQTRSLARLPVPCFAFHCSTATDSPDIPIFAGRVRSSRSCQSLSRRRRRRRARA